MNLCPRAESEVFSEELTLFSEDRQARSGRAGAPSESTAVGGRLLCAKTGQWLKTEVICALEIEVL